MCSINILSIQPLMDEIHVSPGTTKPQKTTSSPTTTVNTSNGTVNLSFSRDLADFKLDPIVNPRRDDLSGVFTENDMHHIPKTISVNVIENISGEPSSSVSQETDGLQYPVDKSPPTHMCIIYGLQQVLLSIGSTMSIPLIVSREICAGDLPLVKSEIMSTFIFMCGICTLLQTTLGVRLPIIQGGCHKFIPAVIALMSMPMWKCPDAESVLEHSNVTANGSDVITIDDEIWKSRMREIQGGIILASLLQVLIGATGILGFMLQYIGPITIVPTITLVGISMIDVALRFCQVHWGVSGFTVFLVFLFSLYLPNVTLPFPAFNRERKCHMTRFPFFKLLPVILAVAISIALCVVLTVTNTISPDPDSPQYFARTDARLGVIDAAKWFFLPYPCQWGVPTFSVSSFMAMLAATLTSIIESVGDYYACARISGVSPPPSHAVNRGILMEGIGSVISGVIGSGGATTSYSQNVGAIGFTKVASRRAFQMAALIFMVAGLCGKIGAVFTLLPDPILGGIVLVSFGMVTSVGLSNLQFVSLGSSRNLAIIGSSLIIGLMAPRYLASNPGCINTGNGEVDRVLTVLLSTAMFVGGFLGFVLDNTVPGTIEERGIKLWRKTFVVGDKCSPEVDTTYDLPLIMGCLRRQRWARYIPFLPTFRVDIGRRCKIMKKKYCCGR
ncbi:solute carrier family 23 member 1-like isoform X2 [Dreissena polymorpha]|uniref:Solute carrier family 23 member 2 n=1 Tax=Dreissena polymorpha TaxID=45954 RepID=A0A9D4LQI2_DREPO|nr:solute carrier family 23 member 1-like isoform X2 [Dreissena polymorpha]KAH3861942.1 hypothetical protein DPMN_024896 [Dreissena polymorpha]